MGIVDTLHSVSGLNSFGQPKLPPGQSVTEKFPVLTYGETPEISTVQWRLRVWGLVEEEREWTWEEFMALPQTTIRADFHCVTRWSRFDDAWTGVLFEDLFPRCGAKEGALFVLQHAYGGYTTNLPIDVMRREDVLFVHALNGAPLMRDHGGPMRVFTPRRYGWKGAKWIHGLEFLAEDRPGFWEANGYSNSADPWKEERYS